MDYDQIEAAITEKTKAVIQAELWGIICVSDRIFQIGENFRVDIGDKDATKEKVLLQWWK